MNKSVKMIKVLGLLLLILWLTNAQAESADLGDSLYELESSWTTQHGETMKLAELRGKVVVMTMFYASCQYSCPITIAFMKRIRASFAELKRRDVRYVLVTFDPARDTVELLKETATKHGFDDREWILLRGDAEDTRELAVALEIKYKAIEGGEISHSNTVSILDTRGRIVKQVNGTPADISSLIDTVRALPSDGGKNPQ